MDADYVLIGGGVVGLSVAWGLLKRGHRVLILDGDDGGFRASRGNFGLIWVQSKGMAQPAYARWSQASAAAWRGFADDLSDSTGIALNRVQNGGLDYHLIEAELEAKVAAYTKLKDELGGDYPFEVLGHNALKKEEPNIGPKVVGAILHRQDGHVNPLKLLQALATDVRRLGGTVLLNKTVTDVTKSDHFEITCADGTTYHSAKVVLTAGLGAATLGPKLGFVAPVRPQRGQVLVTEKLPKLMNRPSGILRQVDEGGIQIGDSKEEVGLDDRTTLSTTAELAARAVSVFPDLARAQMVRAWGALRIMSPDGLPIYMHSPCMDGAYLVTCHSGITLAANHAKLIPQWLDGDPTAPNLEVFSENRFSLS